MPNDISSPRQGLHERLIWGLSGIGGITLLAAVLRFYGLGQRDFWFDESCTFLYVSRLFSWPDPARLLIESTNLPYYAVLRGWTAVFGHSEGAYRSLSALAATLTVPLLGVTGWRLCGLRAGLIATAIGAVHPLHVHYAHEARAYAFWVLLLTMLMIVLIEAVRRGKAVWWSAYTVLLLFCLHLHYYTLFWVPGSAACVLLARDQRHAARRWIACNAVTLALFVPYFIWAVWPAARAGGSTWIADSTRSATALLESLWAFLPSGGYPGHLRGLSLQSGDTVAPGSLWIHQLAALIPVALAVLLVWQASRNRPVASQSTKWSTPHGAFAFLAVTSGLPLLLAWGYSVAVRPIYLPGRYDLVAWPGFTIALALLTEATAARARVSRRTAFSAGITLVFAACAFPPLWRMLALRPPPSFHRLRAEQIAAATQPGDLVIALSYDRGYLSYYLFRAGFSADLESFPPWLDEQIGWVDTPADLARLPQIGRAAEASVSRIAETLERGGRVVLLVDSLDPAGTGSRSPIQRPLYEALRQAGLTLVALDDGFLMTELKQPG